MTRSRVAAGSVVLVLLFAVVATRSWSRPRAADPPRSVETTPLDPLVVAELRQQTDRLRRHLSRGMLAPAGAARDIFANDPVPSVAPQTVPAEPPALLSPVPVEPTIPSLALAGIAEDDEMGTVQRTAIISGAGDELFLVKQGDAIGAGYRAARVDADRVELLEVSSGRVVVLELR